MLLRPAAAQQGPRPAPVLFSAAVHLAVLTAVALGPTTPRRRQSAYSREIAPHEKKLVWYRFNEKLPDVAPAKREPARPERADVKRSQTIASRSPRPNPAKQMTLGPAPELQIAPDLAAPNLIAFEPPKPPEPPKLFVPPPEVLHSIEPPALDIAPQVAAAEIRNPLEQPAPPKLPPKAFVPPQQVARRIETPQLAPGEFRIDSALPAPPLIAQLPVVPKPALKRFTPPPQAQRPASGSPALEAAPAIRSPAANPALLASVQPQAPSKAQPRRFAAPTGAPRSTTAPALDTAPSVTAAIVGLHPIDRPAPVVPEATRRAEFSAAPEITPKGGAPAPAERASITVPDLTIRSGAAPKKGSIATLARVAPTSQENVLAAVRPLIATPPAAAAPKSSAARVVTGGPDPRFEGRTVYTVVLQMPNVTSYSGSWILWYAERKRDTGESREIMPPSPLRKVDPIYDLSAVDDRVEGKVQLTGVIHTDGYVYGINVLRGLDPRLDGNAIAALRKWEFEPAKREGTPVDVDVVIEIPFRLRPRGK